MYRAKINVASLIFKAVLWALLLGILLGYLFGYRYILVNGWSSEPYIPYHSIILTSSTKLQNLKVGDFITYTSSNKTIFIFMKRSPSLLLFQSDLSGKTIFSKQSNVTHQIIAIKYDGYFVEDEEFTAIIDGKPYSMKFGYNIDEEGNISETKETSISTNCNIITMQRTYNQDGTFIIDAQKEYKNFDQVVGRVVGYSTVIGKTLFLLKENKLILLGVFACFVVLLLVKEEFSKEKLRSYK